MSHYAIDPNSGNSLFRFFTLTLSILLFSSMSPSLVHAGGGKALETQVPPSSPNSAPPICHEEHKSGTGAEETWVMEITNSVKEEKSSQMCEPDTFKAVYEKFSGRQERPGKKFSYGPPTLDLDAGLGEGEKRRELWIASLRTMRRTLQFLESELTGSKNSLFFHLLQQLSYDFQRDTGTKSLFDRKMLEMWKIIFIGLAEGAAKTDHTIHKIVLKFSEGSEEIHTDGMSHPPGINLQDLENRAFNIIFEWIRPPKNPLVTETQPITFIKDAPAKSAERPHIECF